MKNKTLAYALDWGVVTPEFYNNEDNIAVHVFNHLLEGKENLVNSNSFIIARLNWYARHLPAGCIQIIKIDDRGQNIDRSTRNFIKTLLLNYCSGVDFLSEGV